MEDLYLNLNLQSTLTILNMMYYYVTMYIDVQARIPEGQTFKTFPQCRKKLQRPCGARCSARHALPEFQPACDLPGTSRSHPVTRFPQWP